MVAVVMVYLLDVFGSFELSWRSGGCTKETRQILLMPRKTPKQSVPRFPSKSPQAPPQPSKRADAFTEGALRWLGRFKIKQSSFDDHNVPDRALNPPTKQREQTTEKYREEFLAELNKMLVQKHGRAISRAQLVAGPPDTTAAAPLENIPAGVPRATQHTYGYLDSLLEQLRTAQVRGDRVTEREMLDTVAKTLENVQAWDEAALKLGHLADVNEELGDPVQAGRALLRQGVAFQRAERFDRSRRALIRALRIVRTEVPRGSALRSELEVWMQLGLVKIRMSRPECAIRIFRGPCTRLLKSCSECSSPANRRALGNRMLPLLAAAIETRVGLALKDMGQFSEARKALLQGLQVRFQYGAFAEVARGLRHLGQTYAEEGEQRRALWLFQICLNWETTLKDHREEARTHFCRAEALRTLYETKNTTHHQQEQDLQTLRILQVQMFSDPAEVTFLTSVSKMFRDSCQQLDKSENYRAAAIFHYLACADKAKSAGLTRLVNAATAGCEKLGTKVS